MKKTIRILLVIFSILTVLIIWFDQSRTFYCLDNNKCITVWKRIGGSCFVIPGKYYGIIKPSDNYIITSNASDMDVVWEKDPSHVIVSMDEGSKIVNNSRNEITITDYKAKKKYNDSLYMSFDGTYLRHRKGTDFIILFIKENYAVDNYGNKMK